MSGNYNKPRFEFNNFVDSIVENDNDDKSVVKNINFAKASEVFGADYLKTLSTFNPIQSVIKTLQYFNFFPDEIADDNSIMATRILLSYINSEIDRFMIEYEINKDIAMCQIYDNYYIIGSGAHITTQHFYSILLSQHPEDSDYQLSLDDRDFVNYNKYYKDKIFFGKKFNSYEDIYDIISSILTRIENNNFTLLNLCQVLVESGCEINNYFMYNRSKNNRTQFVSKLEEYKDYMLQSDINFADPMLLKYVNLRPFYTGYMCDKYLTIENYYDFIFTEYYYPNAKVKYNMFEICEHHKNDDIHYPIIPLINSKLQKPKRLYYDALDTFKLDLNIDTKELESRINSITYGHYELFKSVLKKDEIVVTGGIMSLLRLDETEFVKYSNENSLKDVDIAASCEISYKKAIDELKQIYSDAKIAVSDKNTRTILSFCEMENMQDISFDVFYNPLGDIYDLIKEFHVAPVRSWWDGTNWYGLPSYVFSQITSYMLDMRYRSPSIDASEIVHKYKKRGYLTLI